MKGKDLKINGKRVYVAPLDEGKAQFPTANFTHLAFDYRGITLIALVITIIIMLILVGVSVRVALNGGLFKTAKQVAKGTETQKLKEEELSTGRVQVNGIWYDSIEQYLANNPSKDKDENGLFKQNLTYTQGEYTAVIPKGFRISENTGEDKISTGLVIQDANDNQFVWIPVEGELSYTYSSGPNYSEPKSLTSTNSDSTKAYDSQETLTYYYGTNKDGTNYYDYSDFKYEDEYKQMVDSVNKNHGFYIGRYETTIDEKGNIGSKYNTKVLLASDTLREYNNIKYYYRWYGLYAEQKKANVPENGSNVQTAMIYGVLWDKTMDFIRAKSNYDVDIAHPSWHHGSSAVNSGLLNPGVEGDVALNIWDLESNGWEWTQEAINTYGRVGRGR